MMISEEEKARWKKQDEENSLALYNYLTGDADE